MDFRLFFSGGAVRWRWKALERGLLVGVGGVGRVLRGLKNACSALRRREASSRG